MLPVNEMFVSLQGESTHAGKLCVFLRLAGCNLRCSYCDTKYAWDETAGKPHSVTQLVDFVRSCGVPLVEITGGEPLFHPETPALAAALIAAGFTVLVETNGSLPTREMPPEAHLILDVKLPSSGMAESNCFANYDCLRPHDEIKFVIGGREDYEYAKNIIAEYRLPEKTANLLASPVWGSVAFEDLASWLIEDRSPMRMQLQMHKLIWGAEKTGV